MRTKRFWCLASLVALTSCAIPSPAGAPIAPPADPLPPGLLADDDAALDAAEEAYFDLLAVGPLRAVGTLADSGNAAAAADGNVATAWSNGGYRNATGWVGIRLGAINAFSTLRIKTGPTPGIYFDVQVSDDGNNWRTVLTRQACTTWNLETKQLPAGTSGKFIRVFWRNSTSNPVPHFKVYEMGLTGEGTGSPIPSTPPSGGGGGGTNSRFYPDLMAIPPDNLSVQNGLLRFSNVIPNVGGGTFQVRASNSGTTTKATQEVLNESGRVVETHFVGNFVFHPQHNHTHLANVARYELRRGSPSGTLVASGNKISFCMMDSFPFRSARAATYRECNPTVQGISRGWADLYASDLPDQNLTVRGLAAGEYYLVTRTDPGNAFLDTDRSNNTAWVRIFLNPAAGVVRRISTSN